MLQVKPVHLAFHAPIVFETLKNTFLPQLRHFLLQREALKQAKHTNEKAFEAELRTFLKNTFYASQYVGNRPYQKGEADLVVCEQQNPFSHALILMEVKSPLNHHEFLTNTSCKVKAFYQAVTYFLIELVEKKNYHLKSILITNTEEFYWFDAANFHQLFYRSKLKTTFETWYNKTQSGSSTADFYEQIAHFLDNNLATTSLDTLYYQLDALTLLPEIEAALQETHIEAFNDTTKYQQIKGLYRFFSPVFLQKERENVDKNELNHRFYFELLHILGLKEYQKNGNKWIDRLPQKERNPASFIENTLSQIVFERPAHLQKEGDVRFQVQAEDFETALALCILWISRILFLKLLEAQLQNYHNGEKSFKFLTPEVIKDGTNLSTLFFHVLNTPTNERTKQLPLPFQNVPYLNSSLFQLSYLEMVYGRISGLREDLLLPVSKQTVLKEAAQQLPPITYLLQFLDAYNFGETEKYEVQTENKDLINAAVLGKIFEKLNGYKEGSFYTPSYITTYMSQKVVRQAIINKLNEKYKLQANSFEDIQRFTRSKYKKEDIISINAAINELRICDPAVGSGHFLVAVLNEIIAAKSELEILYDTEGQPLPYWVKVKQDELVLQHKRLSGRVFSYQVEYQNGIRRVDAEMQNVQKALFYEKQTLIENVLYGVDVNPNSVQICRLRLWIELLKNTYYTEESNFQEMQTLPNLDYKVVEGNSLLQTYENQPIYIDWKRKLQTNISAKNVGKNIEIINESVKRIRTAKQAIFLSKSYYQKLFLSNQIQRAKADVLVAKFEIELMQVEDLLNHLTPETRLDNKLSKQEEKQKEELLLKKDFLQKIKRQIDFSPDLGKNIALFDWNLDFAEVMGTFEQSNEVENKPNYGFDIIIGNPPYIQHRELAIFSRQLKGNYHTYSSTADISSYFFEQGIEICKSGGQLIYISTNKFFNTEYGKPLRNYLSQYQNHEYINFEQVPVFDEALVSSAIFYIEKSSPTQDLRYALFYKEKINPEMFERALAEKETFFAQSYLKSPAWLFMDDQEAKLIKKIQNAGLTIDKIPSIDIKRGITTGFDEAFVIDETNYLTLSKNPHNQLILKKLLRGRDIQKYAITDNRHWLINTHNGIFNQSKPIDVQKDFPDIFDFLVQKDQEHGGKVAQRSDQGKHWTNLRNCAFLADFEKEKIVWGLISGKWGFAYDGDGYFLTSAAYFLTSSKIPIKFLLGLFNSRLFQFYFDKTGEYTAGGAYVLKKKNVERFVIPQKEIDYQPFIERVDVLINAKPESSVLASIINELDKLVFDLYDIQELEQNYIEQALRQRKIK